MAKRKSHLRATAAAVCCLAVSLLGGCRNLDNAQTDVLERELRQQEDYIYELEDYLIEYSEKLRQARLAQCPPGTPAASRTGSSTRAPLREPTIDEDPIERPSLPLNGREKLTPPSTEAPPAATEAPPAAPSTPPPSAPATEEVHPEDLEAPELQIGPVGSASPASEPIAANSASDGPLLIPDPVDYQADGDAETSAKAEPAPTVADAPKEPQLAAPEVSAPRLTAQQLKVRHIFREPSEDGKPGSLLVVVEGVNATDEPADVSGAASLMVMARGENGALRRVDRWDFTAEETAAAWQSSHLGDGLHLELPLTAAELPEGELELWARVVDDAGAKLLTAAEDPFRFEAEKLVAMADAPADAMLASNDNDALQPVPADGEEATDPTEVEKNDEPTKTAAAEAPKPQWRASSIRLEKDRVEGFATTAGNRPASWTTTPINGGASARVASSPGKTTSPTWKRSTRAAATESKPEWSADR